jgi:hypothetical protein
MHNLLQLREHQLEISGEFTDGTALAIYQLRARYTHTGMLTRIYVLSFPPKEKIQPAMG